MKTEIYTIENHDLGMTHGFDVGTGRRLFPSYAAAHATLYPVTTFDSITDFEIGEIDWQDSNSDAVMFAAMLRDFDSALDVINSNDSEAA